MYETILIPLDGSPLAESVLPHAVGIAKQFNSRVILLQVVPTLQDLVREAMPVTAEPSATVAQVSIDMASEQHQAGVKGAHDYLQAMSRRLTEEGLTVETLILEGNPADRIVQCAKERDVSLIALSTHGRSGLGRLVFGSVADQVLREAHRPLLLIRPPL